MKYRAGDVVTVKGVVKLNFDAADDSVSIEIPGEYEPIWANPEDVTLVHSKIVLGDLVKFVAPTGLESGRVLAISNDHAWIDLGDGEYATRLLSSIQRDEES